MTDQTAEERRQEIASQVGTAMGALRGLEEGEITKFQTEYIEKLNRVNEAFLNLKIFIGHDDTGIIVKREDGFAFDSTVTLSVTSKPQPEMDKFKDAIGNAQKNW